MLYYSASAVVDKNLRQPNVMVILSAKPALAKMKGVLDYQHPRVYLNLVSFLG